MLADLFEYRLGKGGLFACEHLLLDTRDVGAVLVKVKHASSLFNEPLFGFHSLRSVEGKLFIECDLLLVATALARMSLRLVSTELSLPVKRFTAHATDVRGLSLRFEC